MPKKSKELKYRLWARENYRPGTPIYWWWDSIIRDECEKISREKK